MGAEKKSPFMIKLQLHQLSEPKFEAHFCKAVVRAATPVKGSVTLPNRELKS